VTTPIRTIAVGFDDSPDANAAAKWAVRLARQIDADVVLVHAIGLRAHLSETTIDQELEESSRRLAAEGQLDVAHVSWHVGDGDACSVMLRAIGPPISADLLVVGSRGQGGHAGLLLGSTSLELAEHANLPLVIVPSERRP